MNNLFANLRLVLMTVVLTAFLFSCDEEIKEVEVIKEVVVNVEPEQISINNPSLEMTVGEYQVLDVVFEPADVTDRKITWTNSDEQVVSVDNGTVGALTVGVSKVTATTSNGKETSVTIKVTDPDACMDLDGRVYKTVEIGGRLWMAENYAYLPKVSQLNAIYVEPCAYVYDYTGSDVEEAKQTENYKKYGVLYNYRAAAVSAPKGWRLPTEDEWKKLEVELGMSYADVVEDFWRGTDEFAAKLKSEDYWEVPGSNESGLNMIPAGRMSKGSFSYMNKCAMFWSKTLKVEDENGCKLYGRMLQNNRTGFGCTQIHESYAVSVRYIKEKE